MYAEWINTTDVQVRARRDTSDEKCDVQEGKQTGHYVHTCVDCYARDHNITVPEARRAIKQPRTAKDLEGSKKYEKAKTETMDLWQFLLAEKRRMMMMLVRWFRLCQTGH